MIELDVLFIKYKKPTLPRHVQIKIIFAGKFLDDNLTFTDYNIQPTSTMHAILKMRGGMYDKGSGRNGNFNQLIDSVFVIKPDLDESSISQSK